MHGSDYWAKRFEALENASNKTAKEAYALLEPVFSKAGRELDKEIITWLKRIAINNNIKLADARKMLTKKERQEFTWDVQEYIRKGRENGLSGEYLRELENASAKYHINRLDTLNLRLKNIIETAFNDEHASINSMLKKVYTDNYYKSLFEVQKGFNIGFDIAQVNPDVLNKLLTKPWTSDSLNFSDRIWIARDRMVQDLQQELVRTCVLGKSPDESIKRMSNFVNKKVKNAKMYASRLIMTEQAAFHARSQEDAFKDLDIEEFEVVATLDSHTSEICREMDGKHFPMSEYKIGITAPPFHVYCRSVTAPYFNDEWSGGERAARDENGKTYYVPSDMTYPEWRGKHVIKSNDYTAKTNGGTTVSKNITIPEGNDIKKRFGDILDETLNSKESLVKLSIKELEELEYSEDMNAKLSDKDSRMWYNIKVRKILSLIDESKTLEEQAREAFDLRNKYKHQAREMMVDQEKRKRLDMEKDKTFEQLIEEKRVKYGVDGDDVYRQILGSSKRTNKIVNSVLGLEGE